MGEHHDGHEHQLISVWVLVVASLPVPHPRCQVLVVDDEDVGNATHPHLGVFPTNRVQVHVQRHLMLGQSASGLLQYCVNHGLELGVLRRDGLAVADIELDGLVDLVAVACGLSLSERVVLEHLDFVIPTLTALEVFEGGV